MGVVILLLILAIAAGGFWYLRRGGDKPSRASVSVSLPEVPADKGPPRRPGRMINPGEECCGAARRIATAWYPEGEVPHLPLDSCEHPQTCKCGWMRVLDRRATHRRSEHDRRVSVRFEDKDDRRTGRDRRKDANNPWKNG